MKFFRLRWLGAGLLVAVLTFVLQMGPASNLEGTDDLASSMVLDIQPGYDRWMTPIFEPATDTQEVVIFALQAGGAAAVLAACLGRLRRQSASRY